MFGEKEIFYGTIIISLRGIWCARNDTTFEKLGIPETTRDLFVVRCMEKTIKIHRNFMHAV